MASRRVAHRPLHNSHRSALAGRRYSRHVHDVPTRHYNCVVHYYARVSTTSTMLKRHSQRPTFQSRSLASRSRSRLGFVRSEGMLKRRLTAQMGPKASLGPNGEFAVHSRQSWSPQCGGCAGSVLKKTTRFPRLSRAVQYRYLPLLISHLSSAFSYSCRSLLRCLLSCWRLI